LVLGSSGRTRWQRISQGSVVDVVLRRAGALDVHVISNGRAAPTAAPAPSRARPPGLSSRRRLAGWAIGLLGLPLLTLVLAALRDRIELSTISLGYITVILAAAIVGGTPPGVVTAVAAFLLENFYFVEPLHTFTIAEPENVVSLLGFLLFTTVASLLVNRLASRNREIDRVRAEAQALARSAGALVADSETLPGLIDNIRTIFGLSGVALLARDGSSWLPVAVAGTAPPASPDEGDAHRVDDQTVLVVAGGALDVEDRNLLTAFAGQAAAVLEARRLREDASRVDILTQADAMRTGLLRAVSHDLRTPLAGIKASVTSLLQEDVRFEREQEHEFLETIDEECDRLTRLVTNLLDASRLEAGVVTTQWTAVSVEDLVASAIASISDVGHERPAIEISLPSDLPDVYTDPDLLERVLANLLANAVRYSPLGVAVRVTAGRVRDRVEILIIDQGPGISVRERETARQAFQRSGDARSSAGETNGTSGIGLGLAVAQGFLDLLGGTLTLDDTPGGGLTAILALPLGATDSVV
jgi:two-component system sensor histidine kinase KdpD